MKTFKVFLLLCVFSGIANLAPSARAVDFTSVSIDPNDIQQFEQSYETWVQSLVQNIVKEQHATILVEMNYTQSPERLQTYSELRSTQHLPGLPDVMDPHLSHPSESPVSALVENRKVKIIFERPVTEVQEKVLAEVLNSKLRINRNMGDQLTLSVMESGKTQDSNSTQDPRYVLNVIIGCLLLAALLTKRNKTEIKAAAPSEPVVEAAPTVDPTPPIEQEITLPEIQVAEAPSFKFGKEDQSILNRMMRSESALFGKTTSILDPVHIILKSDPKILVRVVRSEAPSILAQAIYGSSTLFQKTIMSICTPKTRLRIREIAKTAAFKKETVNFAQNLLAAKIHRETQTYSILMVEQFIQSRETLATEKEKIDRIKNQLIGTDSPVALQHEPTPTPEATL